MLRDELSKRMIDCSTSEKFCFKLLCSSCGTWWRSRAIPFSMAGSRECDENKRVIYDALYKREWTKARDEVLEEAVNHFSICPICGGLVCDRCFLICEEIEMCRTCAEKLQECGVPVMCDSGSMQCLGGGAEACFVG